jgi:cob(I)alamin adenosyltransferase
MRLYTRTGDGGQTSLLGGSRVSKADRRVDAYGDVDELNAWLGLARSNRLDTDLDEALGRVQQDLFALGAQLADPGGKLAARPERATLGDEDVSRLEHLIDQFEAEPPSLDRFILPGGAEAGATLHVARAVCRRAERRIVALEPPVAALLVRYMNRLSDFLFVAARVVNHRAGVPETEW